MQKIALEIKIYGRTEKGERDINEDYYRFTQFKAGNKDIVVAAVADGMGGHLSGEVASKIAVEDFIYNLKEELKNEISELSLRNRILRTYDSINQAVLEEGKKNTRMKDMGTTLTGLIMIDNRFLVCSLGDSRAYLIREDEIRQITEDHSAGAESLRDGLITEIEAKRSRYSDSLIKFIGTTELYVPDIFPITGFFWAEKGDIIMLCTDGITKAIEEIDVYEQVIQTKSIRHAANNLVSLSYNRGSNDNMTVLILEFPPLARKKHKFPEYSNIPIPYKKKRRRTKKGKRIVSMIFLSLFLLLDLILFFKLFDVISKEREENLISKSKTEIMAKKKIHGDEKKEKSLSDQLKFQRDERIKQDTFITLKVFIGEGEAAIDGKSIGKISPEKTIRISSGAHKIQFISAEEKKDFNIDVEIKHNEAMEIKINLKTGRYEIKKIPLISTDEGKEKKDDEQKKEGRLNNNTIKSE